MAWQLEGDYVAACSCNLICPCPVDGRPTDPEGNGECRGVAVFNVETGSLDETDLSGVTFALVNYFPSNISAGNWKLGVVVAESASDQQVEALGRVLGGQEGGPFADFAALVGENLGLQRGKVAFEKVGGSIDGNTFSYEPLQGPDGSNVEVTGAPFAFASPYGIGKASGHVDLHGISFDSNYGEAAHFVYGDSSTEHVRG